MGLGAIKVNPLPFPLPPHRFNTTQTAWQRQTLKYGHEQGETYSSLIFDNRGMGGSSRPLMRYSTSEMARDLIELLDHLGWTSSRQLHVTGVSMGGMIAQELVRTPVFHPARHPL